MSHEPGAETAPVETSLEQALIAGDRNAAEQLTRQCYRQIYASLLRWSKDPSKAQDLTQDTFRRAWQSLGSFRGESKFSTWLHRIAYTTFLNSLREATPHLESDDDARRIVDPAPSPRAVTEHHQRDQNLRRAVDRLAEPFRSTILGHYWSELSVADLARAEGISVVAIRKRLGKARRLLEETLGESPIDEAHPS